MSIEVPSGASPKKGRRTSIPLLIGFVILGIGAYYAGPTVMTYAMFYQEQWSQSEVSAAVNVGGRYGPNGPPGAESVSSAGSGQAPGAESGAAGGPPPGGGRGNFDPEAFFVTQDADNNGKLEGSEISERMQARMADIDKDKDGALSKEEFMSGNQRGRGRARPEGESTPAETPASPAIDVNNPPPLQGK